MSKPNNRPNIADAFSRSEKPVEPVETTNDGENGVETAQDAPQGTETGSEVESSPMTIDDLVETIEGIYSERQRRKTVEETHKRTTFLLRNDLAKRLDKLSKGKKGYKTLMLNKAVEAILLKYEK